MLVDLLAPTLTGILPAIGVAILASILATTLLILLLACLLFDGHLARRFGQHAGIVLGVLQEILGGHAVIRQLGIACQHLVFLDDLRRGAAHLAFGSRGIEDAVDDVADGARAVLAGTRAFLGRAHLVLMMALARDRRP